MNDFFQVLRRRLLLLVLCLVVVAAAVMGLWRTSSPTYTYTASLLLLPPEISRAVDPTVPDYTKSNPLFYLGTLGQARDVLIGSLTSKDARTQIQEKYPSVSYEAAADILSSGPIVVIAVESTSASQAASALDELTSSVDARLATLQKQLQIPDDARIAGHLLTRDSTPEVSNKGRIRSAIVVGGGLLLLAFFFIAGLESLSARRGPEDESDEGVRSEEEPGPEGDDDAEVTDEELEEPPPGRFGRRGRKARGGDVARGANPTQVPAQRSADARRGSGSARPASAPGSSPNVVSIAPGSSQDPPGRAGPGGKRARTHDNP